MKMQSIDLSISQILGKTSAILHSDGLILFERLQSLDKNEITISFKDITHCTTAFLNASIGKFITDNKGGQTLIRFTDVTEDVLNKIELVQDNARNEKKRVSLDNSSRGFLHA